MWIFVELVLNVTSCTAMYTKRPGILYYTCSDIAYNCDLQIVMFLCMYGRLSMDILHCALAKLAIPIIPYRKLWCSNTSI